jgi:hypothetical protein
MSTPTHSDQTRHRDRRAFDQHAVRAAGDLLMLGAWLERRARSFSENFSPFQRSSQGDSNAA